MNTDSQARRYVVAGVRGSGKSTIGALLAESLSCGFLDADDLHPATNVEKMRAGVVLTDEDRWPWLDALASVMSKEPNFVVACSALRRAYRDRLRMTVPDVIFIQLDSPRALLEARLNGRESHFMSSSLLPSQLSLLEPLDGDELGIGLLNEEPPELVLRRLEQLVIADVTSPPQQAHPPEAIPQIQA